MERRVFYAPETGMSAYFITSTGTETGKTLVTAALCHQLRKAGRAVEALKPVISGFDGATANDASLILQSLGKKTDAAEIEKISPWRFAAPLSPDMAARRENKTIELDALITFCRPREGTLLIEGAGGVMAPLNETYTTLDWIAALNCPAVLVAGSYLGALSHTLTAFQALDSKEVDVAALIINESPQSPVPPEETLATLKRFIPASVKTSIIPRLLQSDKMWEHVPNLTHFIQ